MNPRKLKTVLGLADKLTNQWICDGEGFMAFETKVEADRFLYKTSTINIVPAVLCGPTPKKRKKGKSK